VVRLCAGVWGVRWPGVFNVARCVNRSNRVALVGGV